MSESQPWAGEPEWVIAGFRKPDGTVKVVASQNIADSQLRLFDADGQPRLMFDLDGFTETTGSGSYEEAMRTLANSWSGGPRRATQQWPALAAALAKESTG